MLRRRADEHPGSLSPWAVEQIGGWSALGALAGRLARRHRRIGHAPRPADRLARRRRRATRPRCTMPSRPARGPVEERLEHFLRGRAAAMVAARSRRRRDRPGRRAARGPGRQAAPARLRPLGSPRHRGRARRPCDDRRCRGRAAPHLRPPARRRDGPVGDPPGRARPPTLALARSRPGPEHPDAQWFGASAAILAGDLALRVGRRAARRGRRGAGGPSGPARCSTACAPR